MISCGLGEDRQLRCRNSTQRSQSMLKQYRRLIAEAKRIGVMMVSKWPDRYTCKIYIKVFCREKGKVKRCKRGQVKHWGRCN